MPNCQFVDVMSPIRFLFSYKNAVHVVISFCVVVCGAMHSAASKSSIGLGFLRGFWVLPTALLPVGMILYKRWRLGTVTGNPPVDNHAHELHSHH